LTISNQWEGHADGCFGWISQRYSTDADSNDREALKLLCPSIAKDIQVELLQDTVARIPVFIGCSTEFIQALTNALEVMFLPAHCTVFGVDDEGDAMYIIHAGVLDVILGTVRVRELRKGDFVGELSLFSNRSRSATVVTTTYSILYKLSRFHTERVLEGYPRFVHVIRQSVMELIAKTDQHAASTNSPRLAEQGPDMQPPSKWRSSRFASSFSQMGRLKSAGLRSNTPSREKSVVASQGGISTDSERNAQSTETPRLVSTVSRLHRVLTGRLLDEAGIDGFHYGQYSRPNPDDSKDQTVWSRLLLKTCVDADSTTRLWWIVALQV
jgi:CRP-like cAMP-binding protein